MKPYSIKFKPTCIGIICLFIFSTGHSGELELSDDINLKIARIKSKSRQMSHTDPRDYIESDDKRDDMFDENNNDCGSLGIGNIEESSRPTFGPVKNETIIIGDVINAGNRC